MLHLHFHFGLLLVTLLPYTCFLSLSMQFSSIVRIANNKKPITPFTRISNCFVILDICIKVHYKTRKLKWTTPAKRTNKHGHRTGVLGSLLLPNRPALQPHRQSSMAAHLHCGYTHLPPEPTAPPSRRRRPASVSRTTFTTTCSSIGHRIVSFIDCFCNMLAENLNSNTKCCSTAEALCWSFCFSVIRQKTPTPWTQA